jgi:hypothetical protein
VTEGGYFAAGPCAICRTVFVFNPELVPSIPVDERGRIVETGIKRPVCAECIAKFNELRAEVGAAPIEILPGAYDVAEGFPP